MKKTLKIAIYLLTLLFLTEFSYSQGGMRFPELSKKIEPYFAEELIRDVERQLPQGTNYSIWGWDVGDYSGDGFFDLALSVRLSTEKKRIVMVYFFVDIDGFLTQVARFPFEFVEMPLEIGVVIRDNTCFITQKNEQFNWFLQGYRFDNGSLLMLDKFHTQRLDNLTIEFYSNFYSLQNTKKYIITNTSNTIFEVNYLTVPSYSRGRLIYKGYTAEAESKIVEYVYDGAYHWSGPEDASYRIKSSYDEENLYLTITVIDDNVVPDRDEERFSDLVELWFDISGFSGLESRFTLPTKDKSLAFREVADSNIYSLKISPGDFLEKKAYVKEVKSTDELDNSQRAALNRIRAVSSLIADGYVLKLKIPFAIFGYETLPFTDNELLEIGFTTVVYDIDNEFRPEEASKIATSAFNPQNPASFGSLLFIPDGQWYGTTHNIYRDDILKYLSELGF